MVSLSTLDSSPYDASGVRRLANLTEWRNFTFNLIPIHLDTLTGTFPYVLNDDKKSWQLLSPWVWCFIHLFILLYLLSVPNKSMREEKLAPR